MACVATAPAPARPQGTTAPTARNFDATAIPHESESASNATIEKVIARSSPPDRLKAARATHVLAEKTPTSLSAPRPATTSGDGSKARPERAPGRAQAGTYGDGLSLLAVLDPEPVVDVGDGATVHEEPAPVGRSPVPDVYDDRAAGRRGSPVPVRVVARVDRRQPGAEEHERARLAVVVRQDHSVCALVRRQRGDHRLHRRDELRPADLLGQHWVLGGQRCLGEDAGREDRQGQICRERTRDRRRGDEAREPETPAAAGEPAVEEDGAGGHERGNDAHAV